MDFQVQVQTHILVAFCSQCYQCSPFGTGSFFGVVTTTQMVLAAANISCKDGTF